MHYMVAYIIQPTLSVLPYKCTVHNMPHNVKAMLMHLPDFTAGVVDKSVVFSGKF